MTLGEQADRGAPIARRGEVDGRQHRVNQRAQPARVDRGWRSGGIVLRYDTALAELARQTGVKSVSPCDPMVAQKHTGYMVGGTSPFGTRKPMPVYAEKTIFDLARIYINGGKRGFLVSISPQDLKKILSITEVEAAIGRV